jgi:UDPglucose--hexose-1-phosphate uridylyltransferase
MSFSGRLKFMVESVQGIEKPTSRVHRRLNLLTGEWVLVSPHRTQRPWLGQEERIKVSALPHHDPSCYLCPGGTRSGGVKNPDYTGVFVFENDFPAMLPDPGSSSPVSDGFFQSFPVKGTSRVICFSPRHDLTLPQFDIPEIRRIIDVWSDQSEELGKRYKWVQVFENKGEVMGCSNPHPHCQIWAGDFIPTQVSKEDEFQRTYYTNHGQELLRDYTLREEAADERIIIKNDDWIVLVPWWAVWPFETLLLPRFQVSRFPDLTDSQRDTLADILKRFLSKYDNLFGVPFPYSMGWHGAPFLDEEPNEYWTLHAHFFPPLLRSAAVKKFMVGYEMLAEPQRDLTPEQAAERLRQQPEIPLTFS